MSNMNRYEMKIIPSPQKIEFGTGGNTLLGEFSFREIDGLADETFEYVRRDFPGNWRKFGTGGFHARFTKGESVVIPSVEVPDKPDAYVLRSTSDGVGIDANDSAGLWYGLQTLTQMADSRGEIPICEIRDHSAICRRGIHWDLKGYQPKFSVLLNEFRRLSKYKVNLILLELEDKYQFQSAPDVGVSGAYTFEQLRALSRHAAALGITVVPKLQCLGHVDYLLKHPRYRHLREGEHPYQYCPRSGEAFELWKAMAGELMDCFAEHKEFFHVGADETDKLGICPECVKHSKVDSYVFHVNRCLDFVIWRGRMPVMWEDIIRNAHGILSSDEAGHTRELGEKAILNYWAYGNGGYNNIFPFLSAYRKQGACVWGASGFSGCEKWDGSVPSLEIRAKNIDAWTKTAIENNLDAVIATGWTRIASSTPPTEPHETSWFTVLYAAESFWNGRMRDCNNFIDALSPQLYGCCLPAPLRRAVLNINVNPFLLQDIDSRFDKNPSLALLQYAAATESFAIYLNELVASRRMFYGQIGVETADYVVNGRRRVLQKFQRDLEDLRKKVKKYLSEFYEPGTVDEYIQTRFEYCRAYADEFLQCLDSSRLL